MAWIISGICIFITIICILKLSHKQYLDTSEQLKLEQDIQSLKHNKQVLQEDINSCEQRITRLQEQFAQTQVKHNTILATQAKELDSFYEESKRHKTEQLNEEMAQRESAAKQQLDSKIAQYEADYNIAVKTCEERKAWVEAETAIQEERLQCLMTPLQLYEMEQQQKRYYTVQVPEEFQGDIDYLLTTVAQQIKHPNIISKLVWAEYIKPAMDETLKRVGIEDKSGIYKITNIESGKCYIGKSTNMKKRLQDHFKASVGIASIADQAIHHAILQEGIWNWAIEPIIYCDKEQLNEMEKYYIDFFKSQTFGYNKNSGGGG